MLNLYALAKIGARIEGEVAEVWADMFVRHDQIASTDRAIKTANEVSEVCRAIAWYQAVC